MDARDHRDLLRYDTLCSRVYNDPRTRGAGAALLLSLGWVCLRDPFRHGRGTWWHRWTEVHGGPERLRVAVHGDVPTYIPPTGYAGFCEARRLRPYRPRPQDTDSERNWRAANPDKCGQRATSACVERDPVTGRHTSHFYCQRHRDEENTAAAAYREAAANAPEPLPNRGGLLAAYFTTGPWEEVYKWASSSWWRPSEHGLSANNWKEPAAPASPGAQRWQPPALSLVPPLGDASEDSPDA